MADRRQHRVYPEAHALCLRREPEGSLFLLGRVLLACTIRYNVNVQTDRYISREKGNAVGDHQG